MTIKKSLIATAVAGALAIPMAAQAGGYGRLAIGINMPNEDATAVGEDDLAINDVSSHFGFKGEDDLGNGMTAFFNYQFDVGGAEGELRTTSTRQSHIGLRGDFGTAKIGTLTQSAYSHVGGLTDWGWIVAAPAWYGLGGGIYARSAFDYAGGSGPFSFGVTLDTDDEGGSTDPDVLGENDHNVTTAATDDSEDIDKIHLGATFDFGQGTVSFSHQSESNAGTGADEPSLTGIGFTYDLGQVGLRGGYYMGDADNTASEEPSGFDLLAHTSFGNGLSGFVLAAMQDFDKANDEGNTTTIGANLTKSLSSRTSLYAEILSESVDGDGTATNPDTDPRTISVGAIHTF